MTDSFKFKKISELSFVDEVNEDDILLILKKKTNNQFETQKVPSSLVENYISSSKVVSRGRSINFSESDKISNQREASLFLRNTTLGPTINEINDLVEIGSKREWLLDQIYGSYDNSTYSEWDGTGLAPVLKAGWFAKIALQFKFPADYSDGNFNQNFPGQYNTRLSLISAFIRNNPVSGDLGSLDGNTRKDPRKSLLCKVTWVLNKLIPVSVPGGGFQAETDSYPIVDWYGNVLARHAFGNYADLLEEVSYNVSMSRMLTHLRNQKSDDTGRQPDENYGREIMQLFSIGLYKLNIDGTYALDANGAKIETYSQDDIYQSSRVFTGLTRWDRPDSEYYTDTSDVRNIMLRGGVGLEGLSRTDFFTEEIVYGIKKPAQYIKKGVTYRIYTSGNTNFVRFGSANNNVGTEFTAIIDGDVNSGTGEIEEKRIYPEGVIPRLKHYVPWYEDGEKNLPNVGIVIPAGTDPETNIRMMCEGLVKHPNCAPNICKNLIKLTITSNPSPEYVARVASVFRDNGQGVAGDMSAVWIAIFTDPEANLDIRSSETKGRILDGFEAWCKIIRSLDCSSRISTYNNDREKVYVDGNLQNPAVGIIQDNENARLGSWPYSSPSVFSYYSLDYSITPASDWEILVPEIGSLPANILMNVLHAISNTIKDGDPIDWRTDPSNLSKVYIPSFTNTLGDLTDVNNVISKLDLLLCGGNLGKEKKKILKELMESKSVTTQDELDARVCVALELIVRSPEYWVH